MPQDMNVVAVVGRLTRDPELRHTAAGDAVCSLRLAVSSRAKGQNGGWEDKPNYFDVTVFGKQGEKVAEYMAKGRRIGVNGRLSWREYTTSGGDKRQSVEIIADSAYFLDSKADGDQPQKPREYPAPAGGSSTPADDLDIPFGPSRA